MKLLPSPKRGYVIVETASSPLKNYITYKIPAKYRVYAEVWHVHESYIPVLLKFSSKSGFEVDTSAMPRYNLESGHADLYLTKDAPRFLVKAAWKALAAYYHPDSPTGDAELFMKFKRAYEKLKGK